MVKDPTQGLDDARLTAEAKYSINFSRSNGKLCLSLHYIGTNYYLFVIAIKIYNFKTKDSEIKKHLLCLVNFSGDFSAINIKNRIKWVYVQFFC